MTGMHPTRGSLWLKQDDRPAVSKHHRKPLVAAPRNGMSYGDVPLDLWLFSGFGPFFQPFWLANGGFLKGYPPNHLFYNFYAMFMSFPA